MVGKVILEVTLNEHVEMIVSWTRVVGVGMMKDMRVRQELLLPTSWLFRSITRRLVLGYEEGIIMTNTVSDDRLSVQSSLVADLGKNDGHGSDIPVVVRHQCPAHGVYLLD